MNRVKVIATIQKLATEFNNASYFNNDPIKFPKHFNELMQKGEATLKDIEISGILSAHLAWGRRDMIVRDCTRMFDEMNWKPYDYIKSGIYKSDDKSLHRTIKWSEFAIICNNLRVFYEKHLSLEELTPSQMRIKIFGRDENPSAANKKIHMFRRWMVRNDGIVDLGLWTNTLPSELIIPLDVHVHRTALELGITKRKSADYKTALEITEFLKEAFPNDPCKGDFALFAVAALKNEKKS